MTELPYQVPDANGRRSIPKDDVFHTLGNPRRRQALFELYEAEGPMVLSDLAERVASVEQDKLVRELDSQERKRVYISLHQSHLPKLEEAGFIEYSDRKHGVELVNGEDIIERYLYTETQSAKWKMWFEATAMATVMLVGLSYVIEWFTLVNAAYAVTTIFVILAFAQLIDDVFVSEPQRIDYDSVSGGTDE